jgi:hypothetical protein
MGVEKPGSSTLPGAITSRVTGVLADDQKATPKLGRLASAPAWLADSP